MHFITETSISTFKQALHDTEKSKATIEKYGTALRKLRDWLNGRELNHEKLLEYRNFSALTVP